MLNQETHLSREMDMIQDLWRMNDLKWVELI